MASISVPCPKATTPLSLCGGSRPQELKQSRVSFQSRSSSLLPGSSSLDQQPSLLRFQGPTRSQSTWKVHAQLNEVAVQESAKSAPVPETKLDIPSSGESNEPPKPDVDETVTDESSISAFMAQVAELVELVDSRDIVELHLKQLGCELIIRKKEGLPQPEPSNQVVMMQPQSMYPSYYPPPQAAAPVSAPPTPTPSSSAPVSPVPAKSNKPSHPPMKSPMAGNFYRSPGPGEPPFVKVGDKVQKGQVICIIEAMKLMNEIEAEKSGTIVEIIAQDGKPISYEGPLVVIEP